MRLLALQPAVRNDEQAVGLHGGLGLFIRTLAERFREADEGLSQLDAELRVRR